jgi:hypothetical protein
MPFVPSVFEHANVKITAIATMMKCCDRRSANYIVWGIFLVQEIMCFVDESTRKTHAHAPDRLILP